MSPRSLEHQNCNARMAIDINLVGILVLNLIPKPESEVQLITVLLLVQCIGAVLHVLYARQTPVIKFCAQVFRGQLLWELTHAYFSMGVEFL